MRFFLCFSFCCCALWFQGTTFAATDDQPIYLEEPEPVPPPKIVQNHVFKEKYKDETLRAERTVVRMSDDSILNHGPYKEFYRDGKPYCEGQYDHGATTGSWKYWHPNGQLCKTISYKKSLPDGAWEVFRQDGSRLASKKYAEGNRQDKWTIYFEDGKQPRIEVHYEKGLREGERITYFKNGQMSQKVTCKKNVLQGILTGWDESGQKIVEGEFVDGKLKGKFQRWESKIIKTSEDAPSESVSSDSETVPESPK